MKEAKIVSFTSDEVLALLQKVYNEQYGTNHAFTWYGAGISSTITIQLSMWNKDEVTH